MRARPPSFSPATGARISTRYSSTWPGAAAARGNSPGERRRRPDRLLLRAGRSALPAPGLPFALVLAAHAGDDVLPRRADGDLGLPPALRGTDLRGRRACGRHP